jgi:hypothetical protein
MRDGYADRSADDRPGKTMSIGDAMIYAEAVMLAFQAETEAAEVATAGAADAGESDAAGAGSDEAPAGRSAPPDA